MIAAYLTCAHTRAALSSPFVPHVFVRVLLHLLVRLSLHSRPMPTRTGRSRQGFDTRRTHCSPPVVTVCASVIYRQFYCATGIAFGTHADAKQGKRTRFQHRTQKGVGKAQQEGQSRLQHRIVHEGVLQQSGAGFATVDRAACSRVTLCMMQNNRHQGVPICRFSKLCALLVLGKGKARTGVAP